MNVGFCLLKLVLTLLLAAQLDESVTASREAFGDEHQDCYPGSVVWSASTVSGDDEGEWDFRDTL